MTARDAEWRTRIDLAACYRVVARNGWEDLKDLVGELSFLDDEPRYAALRAGAETPVFSLSRGRFERLLYAHPWVVYKTMRAIMRTAHAIQRRPSMHMIELSNYFFKIHPKY